MNRCFIFDMDGVLVDTEPMYIEQNSRLFEFLGVRMSHEEHMFYVGISAQEMWSRIRKQFGLKQSVDELILLEKQRQIEGLERLPALSPIPGILELLEDLAALGGVDQVPGPQRGDAPLLQLGVGEVEVLRFVPDPARPVRCPDHEERSQLEQRKRLVLGLLRVSLRHRRSKGGHGCSPLKELC